MSSAIRVLVAKPGLDGHDRGAKVIAKALRDAGMEVIYTGLHQTPAMIVRAALDEDVNVLGLSILSGAHLEVAETIMDLLRAENMAGQILVIIGGIIPEEDHVELKKLGVEGIFTPGTSLDSMVQFIKEKVKK
jgi:methylmalonyl-CoA mutase C-terminal domain/subunit